MKGRVSNACCRIVVVHSLSTGVDWNRLRAGPVGAAGTQNTSQDDVCSITITGGVRSYPCHPYHLWTEALSTQ